MRLAACAIAIALALSPGVARTDNNADAPAKKPVVRTLTDANFEAEVLKSPIPVVVTFCAPWSAPSKRFRAFFLGEARQRVGKITFGEISIDENAKLEKQYDIQSLPTILLFNKGKLVAQTIGFMDAGTLKSFIDSNLKR